MISLIISLFGGATLGGTYALVGLGLVLAFGATRTFNFAHGQLMLLPAFIVGYLESQQVGFTEAVFIALVVSAVVGAIFYLGVLRHTVGSQLFTGIIATFGLAALLDGVMGMVFTAGSYNISVPALPVGAFHIGGAGVSKSSVTMAIITLAIGLAVAAVLRFTHVGLMVRCAGQDATLGAQCGIPVRRIYVVAWALAAVLAAIAGVGYGALSVVDGSMVNLGLAALPAVLLGGLDSIEGALVGGVVIGMIQSFTATYLGGLYVDLITYSLVLVILLFYPQGLFGSKEVARL